MRSRRRNDGNSAWLVPTRASELEMDRPIEGEAGAMPASQETLQEVFQSTSTEGMDCGKSNAQPKDHLRHVTLTAVKRAAKICRSQEAVSLSVWVNEKPPALDQILSAHDVARLTRRRRWVVHALTFLRRFPRRQRFKNRAIGWAKRDVLTWLAERAPRERSFTRRLSRRRMKSPLLMQPPSPMHLARTRWARGPCGTGRKGDRE